MRSFLRSTLAFVGGLIVTFGVPVALALVTRPCRHLALQWLLFWSVVGTAVTYYLAYQVLIRRPIGRSLYRAGILGFLLCVALSIQLPSLSGAVGRSKQVKTMAAMRGLGAEFDTQLSALPSLQRFGQADAWGNPILIATQPGRYVLVSFGECGVPDGPDPWHYAPGPTGFFNSDIVYSNGQFLRYPEGVQQ